MPIDSSAAAADHGAAHAEPAVPLPSPTASAQGVRGRATTTSAAAVGPPRPRWADYASDDEDSGADQAGFEDSGALCFPKGRSEPGRATTALAAAVRPPRPRWADYASDDEDLGADQAGAGAEDPRTLCVPRGSVSCSSVSTEAGDGSGDESEQGSQICGTPGGGPTFAEASSEAASLVNLVLQNIPSRAGSEAIASALRDFGYGGRFAYFYLPCKPRDGLNRGYAFVGFEDAPQADLFRAAVDGRRLPGRGSSKALIVDFANSSNGVSDRLSLALSSAAVQTEWGPILASRGGIRLSAPL